MLYIFYGTDTDMVREKVRTFTKRLREGRDGFYERVTADTFDYDALKSRAREAGLFSGDSLTVLDEVCAVSGAGEIIADAAKDLVASSNMFVLIEKNLTKRDTDAYTSAGADISVFNKKKEEGAWGGKTIFSLADAYVCGDRREAWTLFRRARDEGARDEEITGTLFWRVKTMLLAKTHNGAEDAGLKPFVYTVAKRLVVEHTKESLQKKLCDIISLHHDTRRKSGHLETAIEKFILKGK